MSVEGEVTEQIVTFSLDGLKREFSNNLENTATWLLKYPPDMHEYTIWKAVYPDATDLPKLSYIRANRLNGYIADVTQTNKIFGIMRLDAGMLEGVFVVKDTDIGALAGTVFQDFFTLSREPLSTLVNAIESHASCSDFEDYILK